VSFAASPAQRQAVKDSECAYCGKPGVDPAHIVDRSLGGCDEPLCVLGLCRHCHRRYDEGELNLLSLVRNYYPRQWEHAVGHLGEARAEWRVSNERPQ
jgi:hypothetical protein